MKESTCLLHREHTEGGAETRWGLLCDPGEGDSGLDQGGIYGGDEKRLGSKYILKTQLIGFVDR